MPDLHCSDSLSFGDALFLYLEREGMPLNVASVSIFEGLLSLEELMKFVDAKLPLIPRYRQRVAPSPFNIGLPSWEFDSQFDLRNHIREVTLRRGTEAELKRMAARILGVMMDRSHPLWDLTLVHGLKGNRTGLVIRIHHCFADGLSGVALMNALMDPSPTPPKRPLREPRFQAPPARDSAQTLLDGLIKSCFSTVNQVLMAQSELLTMAQQLISNSKQAEGAASPAGSNGNVPDSYVEQWNRLAPEFAQPAQRLPFNVICRGPQKFNCAEIPLAEIKAVKDAFGAKVNDAVLALVTAAVRQYVELHGVRVRGRLLRIVVPVSVRGKSDVTEVGNQITFLPITIPLDVRSPRKLVGIIRERMTFLKNAHIAELVGFAGTLLGTIPSAVGAVLGPIASQLPLSVCNLICTNVPGPQTPLYLLGRKMLAWYPYVPIGGEMGMNCAVLTYNGTAYFGFSGDAHAVPDLNRMEKFLQYAFAELQKAAGRCSPRRKRARRTPEIAAKHSAASDVVRAAVPPVAVALTPRPAKSARPAAGKAVRAPGVVAPAVA